MLNKNVYRTECYRDKYIFDCDILLLRAMCVHECSFSFHSSFNDALVCLYNLCTIHLLM